MVKRYVLAFVFDEKKENVILIRKNRPEEQRGKLNGLGGKIEEGETPLEAIKREIQEESGLTIPLEDFQPVGVIQDTSNENDYKFKVDVFFAKSNILVAKTLTDEEISIIKATEALCRDDLNGYVKQALISILKSPDF